MKSCHTCNDWGQISYLLSLAYIYSLFNPYMALLFWHLSAVNLLPSVYFVRPFCDYTFTSQLIWQKAQVTESGTDPHVEKNLLDSLSLGTHLHASDYVMLGTWNNWFFIVLACQIKVDRLHRYKVNLLADGCICTLVGT